MFILIILASTLLTFTIAIQNPKGGGLSLGASVINRVAGVRRTTNILEKATWAIASVVVVLSLIAVNFSAI